MCHSVRAVGSAQLSALSASALAGLLLVPCPCGQPGLAGPIGHQFWPLALVKTTIPVLPFGTSQNDMVVCGGGALWPAFLLLPVLTVSALTLLPSHCVPRLRISAVCGWLI